MTTVNLSPIWNGTTFQDANGRPLSAGRIYTYYAGSFSANAITYSDHNGDIPNTNPIVLDSSGRIQTEIWLVNGTAYNLVLTQSDGTTVIQTVDNIIGG